MVLRQWLESAWYRERPSVLLRPLAAFVRHGHRSSTLELWRRPVAQR